MSREVSSSHGRTVRAIFELVENAGLDLEDLIRAVVDIEGRAEYREKNDDILCGGVMARAAGGAGTFAQVALVNPKDSGILGVVEMAHATNASYELFVATQAQMEAAAGHVYGGITTFRDMRRAIDKSTGGFAFPTLKLAASIPAVQTGAGFYVRTGGDSPAPVPGAPSAVCVIPPGMALNIADLIANDPLTASVLWYERIVRKLV
jgi:hypothetical protein